jgi:hypothetical protein
MFVIFVETMTGDTIRACTWQGRVEEGVARLREEFKRFGNTVRIRYNRVK